jgi:hypothetical protein
MELLFELGERSVNNHMVVQDRSAAFLNIDIEAYSFHVGTMIFTRISWICFHRFGDHTPKMGYEQKKARISKDLDCVTIDTKPLYYKPYKTT